MDRVKRPKSSPVMSATRRSLSLLWLHRTVPRPVAGSTWASSTLGSCSAPSTLSRARRWLQKARYTAPFTSNSTSARQSAVWRVMRSLDDLETLGRRGVWWYSARQIASSSVDLPAPMGPVMAKRLFSVNGGWVKSMAHSPLSELRFLRRSLRIFMPRLR